MEKDFFLERVKVLRGQILESEFMTVDEKNRAIDELDDVQETVVYRDFPV